MAGGRFATIEDVITAGVKALQEMEEVEQEWVEHARERWPEDEVAIARGDYFEGSPKEVMARIRLRVEKMA